MNKTTTRPTSGYGIIQTSVMTDPKISIKAKALYAYYVAVQGGKSSSWKSNETIAEELGIGRRQFYKYKKELLAAGYIEEVKRGYNDVKHVAIQYNEAVVSEKETTGSVRNGNTNSITMECEYEALTTGAPGTNQSSDDDGGELLEAALNGLSTDGQLIYDYLLQANERLGVDTSTWRPDLGDKKALNKLLEAYPVRLILSRIDDIEGGNPRYIALSLLYKNIKAS